MKACPEPCRRALAFLVLIVGLAVAPVSALAQPAAPAAGSAPAAPAAAPAAPAAPVAGSAAPAAGSAAPAAGSAAPAPEAAAPAAGSAAPAPEAAAPAAGSAAPAPAAAAPAPAAAAPAPAAPAAAAPAPAEGEANWWDKEAAKPYVYEGTYWLPPAAAKAADGPDSMFIWVLGMSAFFFFGITIAVVYFVIKYRHRPGHKAEPSPAHNDVLEITWTVIPTIITVFLFVYGWRSYIDLTAIPETRPENQIAVTAQKWNWSFRYYNGVEDNVLHVPVDQPVKLTMTSTDVLHSFYVPVFRVKQDVVPRRYTYVHFWPTKPGGYRLYCTEYCGKDHSKMKTKVVVHTAGGYERYLSEAAEKQMSMSGAKLGESVYKKKGCEGCHSLDGSTRLGPSFKGSFGTQVSLSDGTTVPMDETYIRNSLLAPTGQSRPGFPPAMPVIPLSDKEIEGVIEFIKAQK